MAEKDWYRLPDWDPQAQEDFEARLRRARPHNRAQYVRIKATHLAEVGRLEDALALFERVLTEYADDSLQAPWAASQRAEVLEGLGRLEEAEAAYRDVVATHQSMPHRFGQAELRLAELLLARKAKSSYAEVLPHLERELPGMLLTSQRFRGACALARMHRALGDDIAASAFAAAALEVAQEPRPLFPRHPSLDAEWSPDRKTLRQMRRMAAR